jgi:hypothetical protein
MDFQLIDQNLPAATRFHRHSRPFPGISASTMAFVGATEQGRENEAATGPLPCNRHWGFKCAALPPA